jgi:hypothetical protein
MGIDFCFAAPKKLYGYQKWKSYESAFEKDNIGLDFFEQCSRGPAGSHDSEQVTEVLPREIPTYLSRSEKMHGQVGEIFGNNLPIERIVCYDQGCLGAFVFQFVCEVTEREDVPSCTTADKQNAFLIHREELYERIFNFQ